MARDLPEMESYLRDGIRAFCLEWLSLNDLKAEFMEIDLNAAAAPRKKENEPSQQPEAKKNEQKVLTNQN